MLKNKKVDLPVKKVLMTLSAFACTGALYASAAVPIGTNAIVKGEGAVATGKNSVAIGTGAVATGDNLAGDKIKSLLKENEESLKRIEEMKKQVSETELDFNKRYEIYTRVEAAKKKIEANNKLLSEKLRPELNTANENYNALKPGYDNAVNEMNQRLSLISGLNFSLIATDPTHGLDTLAQELKEKSEQGYDFSNDISFYKTYIQSYIKAKGDLNQNKEIYSTSGAYEDIAPNTLANPSRFEISRKFLNEGLKSNPIAVGHNSDYDWIMVYNESNYPDTNYFFLDKKFYINEKTAAISKEELDAWTAKKAELSQNGLAVLNGQKSIFTDEITKQMLKDKLQAHLDYADYIFHAKYEQYCYDKAKAAGNETEALTHLQKRLEYENKAEKLDNEWGTRDIKGSKVEKLWDRYKKAKENWKKTNIDDVESSNTLAVDTLRNQYLATLKEQKKKLDELQRAIDEATLAIERKERENKQLQPTEEDIAEAKKAEAAKQKLEAEKQALKEALEQLKLNDLTDVGANALAYGTNALVTGKNAIGIGTDELVTGEDGVGIGRKNTVSGTQSVAIGTENTVGGKNSGAMGINNSVLSDGSFVIGKNNNINKEAKSNFIFGSDIVISDSVSDSVILGSHSTLSAPAKVENVTPFGVVSVGAAGKERQIQNVAPGRIEASSTDAVNGSQLYRLSELIKNNTNTGAGNVTGADKTVIKDIAKDSVKVVEGTNTTVTETTDKDGNKNYAVNVEANGKIEKNNNNLVTGGTVYQAIEDKIQDKSLIKADNKTISLDKDGEADVIDFSHRVNGKTEGRVITGVVTDPENLYSAANVSYVNASISGVIQEMTSGMNRLEKGMNDAGAGAAALSALEYDEIEPGQKWQIAAGVGNYKGSTAYALGAKYHLNKDISFHMGTTIGNGNNMVNGGFSIALGKGYGKTGAGADVWERMASMQKEIDVLKEQNQKLMEALDKVNELLSRDSSEKENTSEAHRM